MFTRKSRCQEVKELLSPYTDQQLSSSQRVMLEDHLAKCTVCSGELESLGATIDLLHRVPMVSPPCSFAIAEVEPRRRLAPFAWASAATAAAMSAMAFFFVGDAFDLFGSRVIEEGVRQPTPLPADEANEVLDMGGVASQIVEKWPVWQIEIALIGAVAVLGAVTLVLWRRRAAHVGIERA